MPEYELAKPPSIGLHGPVYIPREMLAECDSEISKLAIRHELGDKITVLEKLGLLLISAGHIGQL